MSEDEIYQGRGLRAANPNAASRDIREVLLFLSSID
jgi:hypothetical protein